MADALLDLLRSSLAEQSPVTVFFPSGHIEGVVTRLDDASVELRHESARTVVRLSQIDAVTAA